MKKKILITPLSWGIGHATRCIPVIKELLKLNYEPIIASDSDALLLLQKEFPTLKTYQLAKYNIKYPKNTFFLPVYLFLQAPRLFFVVKKEHQQIQKIVVQENISLIINDNRFGCWHKKIPTVYITHQVNVLSGITTFFTSKIHQNIINKMDACWIPDDKNLQLTGKLSEAKNIKMSYIGLLSRFSLPNKLPEKKYDILVLLSGIETQRKLLEKKLINELQKTNKKILFVRGILLDKQKLENSKNITFVNYLLQKELQQAILQSELVIARSGYSTIMDLAVLKKKCFFIPTPNQKEQEYLAKRVQKLQIAPYSTQNNFTISDIEKVEAYKGFSEISITDNIIFIKNTVAFLNRTNKIK